MAAPYRDPLRRWWVVYRDPAPACPRFSAVVEAHYLKHAEEEFLADGDDWEIVAIAEQREGDTLQELRRRLRADERRRRKAGG